MSKAGRPPPPRPFGVDCAPTGRATCKVCSSCIQEGSLRFLRRTWSRFHDGYDTQYSHFSCGKKYTQDIEEINGCQRLKWSEIRKVASAYKIEIDEKHERNIELKMLNEMLWNLIPQLVSLKKNFLVSLLSANEFFFNAAKITPQEAAFRIADAMLCGILQKCPVCNTQALIQEGGRTLCKGYISATVHCPFEQWVFSPFHPDGKPQKSAENKDSSNGKTEEGDLYENVVLKREKIFIFPEELKHVPLLKKWVPPKGAPVLTLMKELKLNGNRDGETGETLNPKKRARPSETKAQEESETESELGKKRGYEFLGLSFCIVGSTDPPRADLTRMIEKGGGKIADRIDASVSYMLIGDLKAAKNTKRYEDAVRLGIPILDCAFVPAMIAKKVVYPDKSRQKRQKKSQNEDGKDADYRPKGIILRMRKYATHYKLAGGKILRKLSKIKELLVIKKREESIIKAAAANRDIMRPKIEEGSFLLKVDEDCTLHGATRIYVDKKNNAYNCSTLFSDISTGINKFYSLQLILSKTKSGNNIHFFRKWGRVGPQKELYPDMLQDSYGSNISDAIAAFEKKFNDLTGVSWWDRFTAEQQPGRYGFVELEGQVVTHPLVEYIEPQRESHGTLKSQMSEKSAEVEEGVKEEKEEIREPDEVKKQLIKEQSIIQYTETQSDLLPDAVREFISLIFDIKMFERMLKDSNISIRHMPLGSISQTRISKGYSLLRELLPLIVEYHGNTGNSEKKSAVNAAKLKLQILDTSNRYFNTIPHIFTVKDVPPMIDTLAQLSKETQILEDLLEISVANSIMDEAIMKTSAKDKIEIEYEKLNCTLTPLAEDSEDFAMIAKMVKNTHAPTHNTYTLKISRVFSAFKSKEHEAFDSSIGNNMLLWHGSKLTNWCGILSQGLRIAPPQALTTGFMFGKGIYFADLVSKSSNYCFATPKDPKGVVLLCEVALGNPYVRLEADADAKENCAKNGFHSTFGLGASHPDPDEHVFITSVNNHKVKVPSGKPIKNNEALAMAEKSTNGNNTPTLLYNEYVVYSNSQVRIKYVVCLEFSFNTLSALD